MRFFVSLLQNYRLYMSETEFRDKEFVDSLALTPGCADFVRRMLKTQLFDRFIEERREVEDPEVKLFDESIAAKINRSKKTVLTNIGRPLSTRRAASAPTEFLHSSVVRTHGLLSVVILIPCKSDFPLLC